MTKSLISVVAAVIVGTVLIAGTFITIRLRATYDIEARLLELQLEHAEVLRAYAVQQERIATLERWRLIHEEIHKVKEKAP